MTTDPTLAALHLACIRQPLDNDLRLVLADRLEECGQGERAELIRCQIELARTPAVEKEPIGEVAWRLKGSPFGAIVADAMKSPYMPKGFKLSRPVVRHQELQQRLEQLWRSDAYRPIHHPCQWFEVPGWACRADVGVARITWTLPDYCEIAADVRNGFPDHVTCTASAWLAHGRAVALATPLVRVTLEEKEPWPNPHAPAETPYPGKFVWFRQTALLDALLAHDDGSNVPPELFDLLQPEPDRVTAGYPTYAAALAALSDAAILYARPKVVLG